MSQEQDSDDQDTELEGSSSSQGEQSEDEMNRRSPGAQRVSLASLFGSQSVPANVLPLSPAASRRTGGSSRGRSPSSERHGRHASPEHSSTWFQVSLIPSNRQEVLSWHPNRLRAALVTEIHYRLRHIAPKRTSTKKFEPIRELMSIVEGTRPVMRSGITWHDRITARGLYFSVLRLITDRKIRDLKTSHGPIWTKTNQDDKDTWYALHRIISSPSIASVLNMPKLPDRWTKTGEASLAMTPPSKTEVTTFCGYAFTLSFNTDLGHDCPDVIKLVQSGKSGEELYKGMRSIPIYEEAFSDLWEHANKVARNKNFITVNIGMEHSSHGDFEARVHFHVFIGPDLRSGTGFGWNPVLVDLTSEEVEWNGIKPNVKCTRPQKKSFNLIYQAMLTGSYYVAGPKIGSIMKRSTYKPIEDSSDIASGQCG